MARMLRAGSVGGVCVGACVCAGRDRRREEVPGQGVLRTGHAFLRHGQVRRSHRRLWAGLSAR